MKNRKKTRQALMMSILSLLVCVSMLTGSTFAWFTDSTSSLNNVIKSGSLDIEVTANGEDILEREKLFDGVKLWEPGAVAYENITIANVGTLALQFKMNLSFDDQNVVTDNGLGLADVLKVAILDEAVTEPDREALINSIPTAEWSLLRDLGKSGKLYPADNADGYASEEDCAIVIWWEPSDEDNNWNVGTGRTTSDGEPLHISLGVTVFATQLTYEEDSFDHLYDDNSMTDTYARVSLMDGASFNALIPDTATSVVFTNKVAPDGAVLTSISESQDGGVVAWMEGTTFYVSTQDDEKIILFHEDCSNMFYNKSSLTSIVFDNVSTKNTQNMSGMFKKCTALADLDVTCFDTSSVTDTSRMFDYCQSLTSLDLTSFDTSNVENMKAMFQRCQLLTTLVWSDSFKMDSVTDVTGMFNWCAALDGIDVSDWNMENVQTVYAMFQRCRMMTYLDTSDWDLSSCKDFGWMFYDCRNLRELDVSGWDVSAAEDMSHMFADCNVLPGLDMSKWDTSNCKSFNAMFNDCKSFTEIDVSAFDTSNAYSLSQMFEGCKGLEKIIGLDGFDTSNATNLTQMFKNCYSLKELDLTSFDTSKASEYDSKSDEDGMTDFFRGMDSLEKITLGALFSFEGDGTTSCTLPTPASGYWYTADGTAYTPAAVPNLTQQTYYAVSP